MLGVSKHLTTEHDRDLRTRTSVQRYMKILLRAQATEGKCKLPGRAA
jgi:hypothetical protein